MTSAGGYAAWRAGGVLALFAGAWGVLAAVKVFRTEEESGRQELVLAGALSRRAAFAAGLAAVLFGAALLGAALWLGLVVARLPPGESAYQSLATISVALVFAGVAALAGQAAATGRAALGLAGAVAALAFGLRVVADTSPSLGRLAWLTPLG